MIAAVLVTVVGLGAGTTRVTYANAPPDVARVSLYAWVDSRMPSRIAADVDRAGSDITVSAGAGRRVVLRLDREDGTYLIDGPFWWPAEDTARVIERRWRRTVAASAFDSIAGDPQFDWVSAAAGGRGEWPRCFASADRLWTCWGVPHGEDGVLVGQVGDRIWSTVVGRGAAPAFRSSAWARLLVIRGYGGAVRLTPKADGIAAAIATAQRMAAEEIVAGALLLPPQGGAESDDDGDVDGGDDPVDGFQRMLDKDRAKEIADYIDSGRGSIPNSIVLSAQEKAKMVVDGKKKTLSFHEQYKQHHDEATAP